VKGDLQKLRKTLLTKWSLGLLITKFRSFVPKKKNACHLGNGQTTYSYFLKFCFLVAQRGNKLLLANTVHKNTAHKFYALDFYFPVHVSVTFINHHQVEQRYRRKSAAEDASALKSVCYNTVNVIPK
jgi:hypothetical protein